MEVTPMNATEALRLAYDHGVRVCVEDGALALEADREPEACILDTLRKHKDEIITLLISPESVNDEPAASCHNCPACRGTNIVNDVAGQYCIDCRKRIA
jgi:hypothetical protein